MHLDASAEYVSAHRKSWQGRVDAIFDAEKQKEDNLPDKDKCYRVATSDVAYGTDFMFSLAGITVWQLFIYTETFLCTVVRGQRARGTWAPTCYF